MLVLFLRDHFSLTDGGRVCMFKDLRVFGKRFYMFLNFVFLMHFKHSCKTRVSNTLLYTFQAGTCVYV